MTQICMTCKLPMTSDLCTHKAPKKGITYEFHDDIVRAMESMMCR